MGKLGVVTFVCILLCICAEATEVHFPWIVYYNDQATPEEFAPYNPIVLDHTTHPPIAPLVKENKEVLGYFCIAESEERDTWFAASKERGLLIEEDPNWPGSWIVDLRDQGWEELIFSTILPQIFRKPFTGIFLDQIDVSLALEEREPTKYMGMKEAAIRLIKKIKEHYPNKSIMLNRAYQLLPEIGGVVDYELAETLFTLYNFETKTYELRDQQEVDWQLAQVNGARKLYPSLVIFSLDYWDPEDVEMYSKLYKWAQERCVRPYVSTLDLKSIIPKE